MKDPILPWLFAAGIAIALATLGFAIYAWSLFNSNNYGTGGGG